MRRGVLLALTACVLAAALALTYAGAYRAPAASFDTRLEAARRMSRCMDAVRGYKKEAGLSLPAYDWHETGLLGDEFTVLTTTSGQLEAKRTTANPDMAALMVSLLEAAGVGAGDTVGAGFSGSFPAMNIATACACDAMGVRLVFIASVGASMYGANQPELTGPDMLWRLYRDGLIVAAPAAFSPGGDGDVGRDMDAETLETVLSRLAETGVPVLRLEDYGQNLDARMAIYREGGPIDCFVAVGGNITSAGRNQANLGQGLIRPGRAGAVTQRSGLLELYGAEGLPVIQILNIRRLVADAGLPFDPDVPAEPGQSAVYYETRYPRVWAAAALPAAAALLWAYARRGKGEKR